MTAGTEAVAARGRRTGLGLLQALSLDAPLLAAAWAALLAERFGAGPDPARLALLAAGVWLAYSADRLLDGLRLRTGAAGTERHEFAIRHRAALAAVWALVLATAAGSAPFALSAADLSSALLLASAGGIYVVACQLWPRSLRQRPPRELLVGALVAAAALLFSGAGPAALPFVALFALLCALDCAAISVWERAVDHRRGEPSLAQTWAPLGRRLPLLCRGLAALGLAAALGEPAFGAAVALGALWIERLHARAGLGEHRAQRVDLGLAALGLLALGASRLFG